MPTRQERIAGGLFGLLVGDALGVPYEFHPPGSLPGVEQIEFEPPPGFARAHPMVPPGTWSDDGAQALALLASLRECGRFDPEDFGRKLLAWRDEGYMAVDGHVFDCGIQTSRALSALRQGVPPDRSGPSGERDNGNGSLMRVLPLALWHTGDDASLAADACVQSRVTHGHTRSQVCCALYCLWARRVLDEDAEPWNSAVLAARSLFTPGSPARIELDEVIRPDEPSRGKGHGYVLDSLHSARMVLEPGEPFEPTVKAAVALGHDTDTTAAIAGGLAGLRDGLGSIPARWLSSLRGLDLVEPLLEGLGV